MKTFTCVKTVVASLLLASTAVAWALPPQYLYGTSTSALESGPIAITTTVPTQKNLLAPDVAAYVVAAEQNTSYQLEVIAWQDTHDAKTGFAQVGTQVEDRAALSSVAITGLDSSRVVTADIDPSTGTLSINTWSIGVTDGVVHQNGTSTAANTVYQNVAITTLSPTEVVTAYQLQGSAGSSLGASLAVEAWTIAADGSPTPEGAIAILPLVGDIDEVSIATVNSNEVVTAANDDDDNTLWVATWGVDSAGVSYQQSVPLSNTVGRGSENLGIGAGTSLRFVHNPIANPELVQSAFTSVIYGGQVAVIYWDISATGGLTQENVPVWTTTPANSNFEVAACMVAGKVPMTIYGNDDGYVTLEVFPYSSSIDTYSAIKNVNQYGITSIASAAAGDDYNPIHLGTFNGYFVTAVLTYFPVGAPSTYDKNLHIKEYSYPVEPTLF